MALLNPPPPPNRPLLGHKGQGATRQRRRFSGCDSTKMFPTHSATPSLSGPSAPAPSVRIRGLWCDSAPLPWGAGPMGCARVGSPRPRGGACYPQAQRQVLAFGVPQARPSAFDVPGAGGGGGDAQVLQPMGNGHKGLGACTAKRSTNRKGLKHRGSSGQAGGRARVRPPGGSRVWGIARPGG